MKLARLAVMLRIQKRDLNPPSCVLGRGYLFSRLQGRLTFSQSQPISFQNCNESIFRNERDICAKKTCLRTKPVVILHTFGGADVLCPPPINLFPAGLLRVLAWLGFAGTLFFLFRIAPKP